MGTASREPDPALKARWVTLHPYAAFYAGLGDFQLWRFRSQTGQFVGGFASAHRFDQAELAADDASVRTMADAENDVIAQCNGDHKEDLDAIASAQGGVGSGWRMVACDVDGCDLAREDATLRIPWSAPNSGADAVPGELIRLASAARNFETGAGPA